MSNFNDFYTQGARGQPFTDSNEKKDNLTFDFLFFLLRWSFVILLSVFILRFFSGLSTNEITFDFLLNKIAECPDYYTGVISFLKENTIIDVQNSLGTVSELIFGDFLVLLSNLWNILVYFCGTAFSGLKYLAYLITCIF